VNLIKLRTAEVAFLERDPGGFDDPEMVAIARKHRVGQLAEQTRDLLAKKNFSTTGAILDDIVRIVSRSSMVSMFEKPKLRDYLAGLSRDDRVRQANAYRTLLHGNQRKGIYEVLAIMEEGRLAKWSQMTICPFYFRPQREVFVKPTTTKGVIRTLVLEGLEYRPRPSWDFYAGYREAINDMKGKVNPSLAPNNAAFTGFLMMTLGTNRRD
jgi:hypothetical protein